MQPSSSPVQPPGSSAPSYLPPCIPLTSSPESKGGGADIPDGAGKDPVVLSTGQVDPQDTGYKQLGRVGLDPGQTRPHSLTWGPRASVDTPEPYLPGIHPERLQLGLPGQPLGHMLRAVAEPAEGVGLFGDSCPNPGSASGSPGPQVPGSGQWSTPHSGLRTLLAPMALDGSVQRLQGPPVPVVTDSQSGSRAAFCPCHVWEVTPQPMCRWVQTRVWVREATCRAHRSGGEIRGVSYRESS